MKKLLNFRPIRALISKYEAFCKWKYRNKPPGFNPLLPFTEGLIEHFTVRGIALNRLNIKFKQAPNEMDVYETCRHRICKYHPQYIMYLKDLTHAEGTIIFYNNPDYMEYVKSLSIRILFDIVCKNPYYLTKINREVFKNLIKEAPDAKSINSDFNYYLDKIIKNIGLFGYYGTYFEEVVWEKASTKGREEYYEGLLVHYAKNDPVYLTGLKRFSLGNWKRALINFGEHRTLRCVPFDFKNEESLAFLKSLIKKGDVTSEGLEALSDQNKLLILSFLLKNQKKDEDLLSLERLGKVYKIYPRPKIPIGELVCSISYDSYDSDNSFHKEYIELLNKAILTRDFILKMILFYINQSSSWTKDNLFQKIYGGNQGDYYRWYRSTYHNVPPLVFYIFKTKISGDKPYRYKYLSLAVDIYYFTIFKRYGLSELDEYIQFINGEIYRKNEDGTRATINITKKEFIGLLNLKWVKTNKDWLWMA